MPHHETLVQSMFHGHCLYSLYDNTIISNEKMETQELMELNFDISKTYGAIAFTYSNKDFFVMLSLYMYPYPIYHLTIYHSPIYVPL